MLVKQIANYSWKQADNRNIKSAHFDTCIHTTQCMHTLVVKSCFVFVVIFHTSGLKIAPKTCHSWCSVLPGIGRWLHLAAQISQTATGWTIFMVLSRTIFVVSDVACGAAVGFRCYLWCCCWFQMLPVVLLLVSGVADGDVMLLAVIIMLLVTGVASCGFSILLVTGFASDQLAVGYIYTCCQCWCSSDVWLPYCWLQVLFFSCVITMLLVTGGVLQMCDHHAVGYSVASGGVFSVVGSICC